jgi:hypothetical protein
MTHGPRARARERERAGRRGQCAGTHAGRQDDDILLLHVAGGARVPLHLQLRSHRMPVVSDPKSSTTARPRASRRRRGPHRAVDVLNELDGAAARVRGDGRACARARSRESAPPQHAHNDATWYTCIRQGTHGLQTGQGKQARPAPSKPRANATAPLRSHNPALNSTIGGVAAASCCI